jgi:uncharacterized membrane protein YhaH (DUF805 family)
LSLAVTKLKVRVENTPFQLALTRLTLTDGFEGQGGIMSPANILFSAEGRIRRRDYWLYSIGLFVAVVVIYVGVGVATGELMQLTDDNPEATPTLRITELVLNVAMIWPSLCLQIKRWHDRDKGWVWILINLIPIVGWIWSFIELGFLDGTPRKNSYGNSPKGLGVEATVKAFE